MSVGAFTDQLAQHAPDRSGRQWHYVPYDQLSASIGPLSRLPPREAGIVLVEAPSKAARRPYHQQKLALVLSNQRHFALEQAARGVAVDYVFTKKSYGEALAPLAKKLGGLTAMEPAERELRKELAGLVSFVPHEGFLTTRADFLEGTGPKPPWRMDSFYRHVRKRTGVLMEGPKPAGGRFSFDTENRQRWKGTPAAPVPPTFTSDDVTREVLELIRSDFAHHPGTLDAAHLPSTLKDAEKLWRWALSSCLPSFGPFEDAMSTTASGLFHTRISPLLNLHRLLPRRVVADVVANEALPLQSREGFVRQILGWREFVRHVHVETDGFRTVAPSAKSAGDGGWGRWAGAEWKGDGPGGARPDTLGAKLPLPVAYWGAPSGLNCLDTVVKDVWRDAWSHHITRLMVLSNLATLVGWSPRELTDWFWVAYADAYDWVVEPNVLAMGTFAAGELMTTKPYISGAAYIDKMSDYCKGCAFDPKKNCPIARLYWAFLARHEPRLAGNPRLMQPMASLRRRSAEQRAEDVRVHAWVAETLGRGEVLKP